jgi:hypothetical protein
LPLATSKPPLACHKIASAPTSIDKRTQGTGHLRASRAHRASCRREGFCCRAPCCVGLRWSGGGTHLKHRWLASAGGGTHLHETRWRDERAKGRRRDYSRSGPTTKQVSDGADPKAVYTHSSAHAPFTHHIIGRARSCWLAPGWQTRHHGLARNRSNHCAHRSFLFRPAPNQPLRCLPCCQFTSANQSFRRCPLKLSHRDLAHRFDVQVCKAQLTTSAWSRWTSLT